MYKIIYYKTLSKKSHFQKWFDTLDNTTQARIAKRLLRLVDGNFGDYKKLAPDLFELRLNFSSGYRVYYTIVENTLVILLGAGNKKTQIQDIDVAKKCLIELKERMFNNGK